MPNNCTIISIKVSKEINEALLTIASKEEKTRHAIAKQAILTFLDGNPLVSTG